MSIDFKFCSKVRMMAVLFGFLAATLLVAPSANQSAYAESIINRGASHSHQGGSARGAVSGSTSCLPAVLRQRLRQVAQRFGPVKVISTFRRNARIRNTRRPSMHRYCRAVDFVVRDKKAALRWLRRNHDGGLGVYYGRHHHIHIDNGPRRRWVN